MAIAKQLFMNSCFTTCGMLCSLLGCGQSMMLTSSTGTNQAKRFTVNTLSDKMAQQLICAHTVCNGLGLLEFAKSNTSVGSGESDLFWLNHPMFCSTVNTNTQYNPNHTANGRVSQLRALITLPSSIIKVHMPINVGDGPMSSVPAHESDVDRTGVHYRNPLN